jgi:O-antigen/teichoic acid export membrane protein
MKPSDGASRAASMLSFAPVRRRLERVPNGLRRVAASAGWLTASQVTRLAVGLLVGLYVARYLGPESFGLLNYAISFALLFGALAQLGLADIVVRDLVADPGRGADTLGSAFALRLASGTLAAGLAAAAAWGTQADPATRLMVLIVAAGLFFEALDVSTLWFRSRVLARPAVLAGLVALGAASCLRVSFVLLEKPVIWFAWPVLFDAALRTGLVFAFYLRHRAGPPLVQWRPNPRRLQELLVQSWPLALSGGLFMIQLRIDQVMLGAMVDSREVGWYAAAVRLSDIWRFIPFAVATTVFPAIVRARATSRQLYDRRMQAFYDFMLWLAVAIALPATLLAEPLVGLLYGDAYGPSADVLQIHIWALVLSYPGTVTRRWMVVEGFGKLALRLAVLAVTTNVALNLLLIPAYGATGAAWATLATSAPMLFLRFTDRRTRPPVTMMAKATGAPIRLLAKIREARRRESSESEPPAAVILRTE